jgi:hypothetical protein
MLLTTFSKNAARDRDLVVTVDSNGLLFGAIFDLEVVNCLFQSLQLGGHRSQLSIGLF